jgi:glycosyltransferase involved in cell wall biosynthesis
MPGLLIITYHFPPSAASGAFRMLGFARHLPGHGVPVSVVAPPGLPWEPSDQGLAARVPPQTAVYSSPYPSHAPKAVKWLMPWSIWLWGAREAVRRAIEEQRPDAVLTSGPPHCVHLLGSYAQRFGHIPWIADFRDPWVTTSEICPPTGLYALGERFWEARVFRHADALVVNTPHAMSALAAACPHVARKLHAIPNGYDPEAFPAVGGGHEPGAPVRILHAGELYAGRDPRPLLDAVAGIPAGAVPPFRLEFLGRIEYEKNADLPAEARKRGIEGAVVCRGQVPYREALGEMCRADALLLMDSPGRKIGVPAKLYEYLGAGRPILATGGGEGDLAAVLNASGVPHALAPCDSVDRLRDAVTYLVRGIDGGTLPTGPEEGRRQFTRQALAGRLAELVGQLAARNRRRTRAAVLV